MVRLSALCLAAALATTGAFAQPLSPRQTCAADAIRLCPNLAGHERGACIRAHWQDLSSGCRSAIEARQQWRRAHPGQGGPQQGPGPGQGPG